MHVRTASISGQSERRTYSRVPVQLFLLLLSIIDGAICLGHRRTKVPLCRKANNGLEYSTIL
jgi:hypothetical protein